MPARFEDLPPETKALLIERYGERRSQRWRWVAFLVAVIALPWLMWTAWFYSNPEIRTSPVRYETLSDQEISLSFELIRRDPAQEVACTLIALDIDKNVVGEIELQVPGAKEGSILVNAKIPTRLRAVNASVDSCRLP